MAKKRNLPTPHKGTDLTIEEKIQLAEQACELYSTDQYTIKECLREVGIKSESTWAKWCREIEEIAELYNKAKFVKEQRYQESLVQRGQTGLERAIEGFFVDLLEQEGTIDDKGKFVVTKAKKKQVYIRPSVKAITYVLSNLKPGTFTNNPRPDPADTGRPDKLVIEIKGGSVPPITSEDDIADIIE